MFTRISGMSPGRLIIIFKYRILRQKIAEIMKEALLIPDTGTQPKSD